MDNHIHLINLYDYYGELLTEKQQEYFEEYYFNNLSLAEISENENVSRNAVHKQLKESANKLEFYEEKLELLKKSKQIQELIKTLDQKTQEKIKELI
ncbi:MAG: hypothetical protein HFH46_01365 [Bacilli bacterium]|nr:hypothetical protein [Bacilli bacterium]